MAEIPVEKKSGVNWLAWLLLLLGILALLWFLFSQDDDRDEVVAEPAVVEQPAVVDTTTAATAGAITTLPALMAGPLTGMAGRQVQLTGVPVESVTGDEAFYIGDSATNRAYVLFNELPTPNTAQEGNVDVNEDSTVTLSGTVMNASDAPAGKTIPSGVEAFIMADSVDVVS